MSPAGSLSRLCTLCFYSVFLNSVFTVTLMRAGLSYMGMPARAHSAVPAPSPTLHQGLLSQLLRCVFIYLFIYWGVLGGIYFLNMST